MKELINTNTDELNTIKATINNTINCVQKAINIIKDKETINIELIYKLINTDYIKQRQSESFYKSIELIGVNVDMIAKLPIDTRIMYQEIAYNKIKHLYESKELFKNGNCIDYYHINNLKYITIKDNKAELIENFEDIVFKDCSTYTENAKQDKALSLTLEIKERIKELIEMGVINSIEEIKGLFYQHDIYGENKDILINENYIKRI